MEHRCSVRKPLEFQLLLYKHGLPIQSGVSRNLGLGGLFIETSEREWRKNEYLEIEILGRNGLPSMRLHAVVVHHNGKGAGVMFDVVTGAQRRRLRAWLFDKRPEESKSATSLAVA
jgi:PilZ domain